MINKTIAEAFLKTEKGNLLVVESKKDVKEIGPRVKAIKELFHGTFVEMPRTTRYYYKRFYELMDVRAKSNKPVAKSPFELFKAAKPVLKKIAVKGGKEYKDALMTVQSTWSSQKTLNDTIKLVLE